MCNVLVQPNDRVEEGQAVVRSQMAMHMGHYQDVLDRIEDHLVIRVCAILPVHFLTSTEQSQSSPPARLRQIPRRTEAQTTRRRRIKATCSSHPNTHITTHPSSSSPIKDPARIRPYQAAATRNNRPGGRYSATRRDGRDSHIAAAQYDNARDDRRITYGIRS
jgi:hypothetical protein